MGGAHSCLCCAWRPSFSSGAQPPPAPALQGSNRGVEHQPGPGSLDAAIQRRSYYFHDAGKDIEYAIFVPSGRGGEAKMPLLVLLHGMFHNPHQVIRYPGVVEEAERRGYIVVAPYGYNERGWYGSQGAIMTDAFSLMFGSGDDPKNLGELSERDVLNVLEIVRKEYRVDENRIYLSGHSMGGAGTLYLGATYPDIWAALAPMSTGLPGKPATMEAMKHIPVMLIAVEKDGVCPVEPMRQWVAAMLELQFECKYKEISGGDHWTVMRSPETIAEMFDFFDMQSRRLPSPPASGVNATG